MCHGPVDHGFAALGESFVILAQSAVAPEPGEGPFHDPALGQDDESGDIAETLDDFQRPAADASGPVDQLPSVATVGPNQLESRETAAQFPQHELGSIAVLDVGGVDDHSQDQTEDVDHDVPLSALDFLARVVSTVPPFSAVFTDWLSMIAAEGIGCRPASTRTCRRRAS